MEPLRSGYLPLAPLMNRAVEHAKKRIKVFDIPPDGFKLDKQKLCELPPGYENAFTKIKFSNFSLSNQLANSCCYLNDGSIVLIELICHYNNEPVILGRQVVNPSGISYYPLDSRTLGIVEVEEYSELQHWSVAEIEKKGVIVSCSELTYIFPMIHTNK